MQISDFDVVDTMTGDVVDRVAVETYGTYFCVNETGWSQLVERYGMIQLARGEHGTFKLLKVPGRWTVATLERSVGAKEQKDRCPKCKGQPKFVRTALMCCGAVLGGF
jgi:hypothetical protein